MALPSGHHVSFSTGDIVAGRYRMVKRIARGGVGEVWSADDLVLRASVALKLLPSAGSDDRARVVNEVRVARQITHPSVCRVFDVGQSNDTAFLSMELVPGDDLAGILKRTGRLLSERVVEIAHQLCAGLAAAHAKGVLHGDLRLSHILIDQDGQARITDFGNARTGDTALDAQWARTDIQALGVVLYELVTGQRPDKSGRTSLRRRLRSLAPGLDARLERAIVATIADDSRNRPKTVLEMAALLPPLTADTTARPADWSLLASLRGAMRSQFFGRQFEGRFYMEKLSAQHH